MKDYIKYGVWLVIALIIAYICTTLRNCGDGGQTSAVLETPTDTSFSPIVKHDYRPASTPFEHPLKPPAKMPKGINEKKVKSVLLVIKSIPTNDSTFHRQVDTTAIITMKDGHIFIGKQNGEVLSVDLFTYQPPILDSGLFVSLGVSLSLHEISPAVAICPLQICGAIQFPTLAADLFGLGAGVFYRWKDINAGVLLHYSFNTDRQLKLMLAYNF